jgi:hypothetical protein
MAGQGFLYVRAKTIYGEDGAYYTEICTELPLRPAQNNQISWSERGSARIKAPMAQNNTTLPNKTAYHLKTDTTRVLHNCIVVD